MKSLPLPPAIELHQGGPRFWRSLEEWSRSPEFLPFLHREFPQHASEWDEGREGFSRRRFLQLMGASFALAGLSACTRQAQETIVPYVKQPEEIIPGRPIFYADNLSASRLRQGRDRADGDGAADAHRG